MPRHILIKLTKLNTKNFKSIKGEATSNIQGNPTCLTADLSAETLQAKREWQDIFKVLKGKNLQPRLLYPARISFQIDGEIKSFSDKQGKGTGDPLQYSCLENPMDGGAW